MTAATAVPRLRLASPATAVVAGTLLLALAGAVWPLAGLARQSPTGGNTIIIAPAFAIVGFLLALRRPRNPLGWLMCGAAIFLALSGDASLYAIADYRLHHGRLPLGWVAMLAQPGWAPAIVAFGLVALLFPDGRLPSPRWRWVVWAYLATGAFWMAGAVGITISAILRHHVQVDTGGNLIPLSRPTGGVAWWGVIQNVFFPALGVIWLASLGAQVSNWRRSSGDRRQQLKWLITGAAIALIGGAATISLSNSTTPMLRAAAVIGGVGIAALPAGLAVAILRYRLYDIDRIVSRTLAYAIVTGLLIGVYAGLVILATQVLSFSSPVAVAASTLAAAALFSPLRRRVQKIVDRRFNRARYDADRTIAAFASRLQDATDVDAVRADLMTTARTVLEPAHASVWLAGSGP